MRTLKRIKQVTKDIYTQQRTIFVNDGLFWLENRPLPLLDPPTFAGGLLIWMRKGKIVATTFVKPVGTHGGFYAFNLWNPDPGFQVVNYKQVPEETWQDYIHPDNFKKGDKIIYLFGDKCKYCKFESYYDCNGKSKLKPERHYLWRPKKIRSLSLHEQIDHLRTVQLLMSPLYKHQ